MMMSINLETSAWNSNFSALPLNDFSEMDSVSLHQQELSMLRYDVPVELGHKFILTAFIAIIPSWSCPYCNSDQNPDRASICYFWNAIRRTKGEEES
jgi:hypothetical protein